MSDWEAYWFHDRRGITAVSHRTFQNCSKKVCFSHDCIFQWLVLNRSSDVLVWIILMCFHELIEDPHFAGPKKNECVELLDSSHALLCCCLSQVDMPNQMIECCLWASEEKPLRKLDVSPAVELDNSLFIGVTFFCTNLYFSDLLYSSVETVSRLKFGNRVWGGLRVPTTFYPVGAHHNQVAFPQQAY